MARLRFIDGPWDGSVRDMEPIETGDATIEAFYTDDPGAGFYKAKAGDELADASVELDVFWHPSVLRG